jgi:hypothetical protein
MKTLITLLALLPTAAFAYGSHVNVLNTDAYTCQLRNARGAVIEADLQRTFEEDKITKKRFLFTKLTLGNDPDHFEHLGSKLEKALGPTFGSPAYDESSIEISLQDERDLDPSTPYSALPLINFTEQNAWRADSQDDLTIAVSLAPEAAALLVNFTLGGHMLRFQGSCQHN